MINLKIDSDTVDYFRIYDKGFLVDFTKVKIPLDWGTDLSAVISSSDNLKNYFQGYNLIYKNEVHLKRILKRGVAQVGQAQYIGTDRHGIQVFDRIPSFEPTEVVCDYVLEAYVANVPAEYFIRDICD